MPESHGSDAPQGLVFVDLVAPPATACAEDFGALDDSQPLRADNKTGIARDPVEDVLVAPYAALALLNFYNEAEDLVARGCGAFIGPDTVLTAGHNVSASGAASIAVFPAYDAVQNPAVESLPVIASVRHPDRDAGVLLVGGAHTDAIWMRDAIDQELGLMAGYAHHAIGPLPQLTAAEEEIALEDEQFSYAISVLRGDSGAPLLGAHDGAVIGIHFYGENRPAGFVGLAERLDADLQAFVFEAIDALRARVRSSSNHGGHMS